MTTFSMEILPENREVDDKAWAGRPVRRNLCHRPGSGISMFVRVIAGPHQRSRFNVAETETQSLVPQVDEFPRRVKAGNRKVIF